VDQDLLLNTVSAHMQPYGCILTEGRMTCNLLVALRNVAVEFRSVRRG
jgi:hypothetical protein